MSEFKWYASADSERFTIGPCDTREQVIAEAEASDLGLRQDEAGNWSRLTFHIVEARQDCIELTKVIEFDQAIEDACVQIDDDHGDPDAMLSPQVPGPRSRRPR